MSKMKKMFKLGSKKHADPDEWTKSDDKLVAAVQSDDLEKIEILMIKKGVHPTKLNPQGLTAIHIAALEGRLGVIQYFQEKNVDLLCLDYNGQIPLHCASKGGHVDLIRYLLQLFPESLTDADHNDLTPLHHACLGGSLEATRYLIHAGAPASKKDKVGRTPLFIAARFGKQDLVKELLDSGADINHRDYDRKTALMFAVEYHHIPVVEYLVRRGADVLLTDSGGRNATTYAQETAEEEILNILENAPSRASWSLDKEEKRVEDTKPDAVESADMVARFQPEEDNQDETEENREEKQEEEMQQQQPAAPRPVAPSRKPKQAPPPPPSSKAVLTPPPGFGSPSAEERRREQMEKFEQGVIPLDEATEESEEGTFMSTKSSVVADEVDSSPAVFDADVIIASEATVVASAISEPSSDKTSYGKTQVDTEAYRELEEEHESLSAELQRVSLEKKRLEDQFEHLVRRLSDSENGQTDTSVTAPVQLAHARAQIEEDKEKMASLEDEVKLLRKQIDIDSKPEAERNPDDSWDDSDEDLFENEVDAKKKLQSGGTDGTVVALLRSRVLSLEKEIQELKSSPQHPAKDATNADIMASQQPELSESATERDLVAISEYSALQEAHDAECQELKSRIEWLMDENVVVKDMLNAAEEKNVKFADENKRLEKTIETISQKRDSMEKEVEEMKKELSLREESEKPTDVMLENLQKEEVIHSVQASTTQLLASPGLLKTEEEMESLRNENKELQETLRRIERENEKLNAEFGDIHSQVQGLEGLAQFNTELTQENDKLKQELEDMKSSNSQSANQRAMAQLTMQLQQENNDLKSENRSLKSQIADIENSLKATMAQKGQQRLQESSTEEENTRLKQELSALKQAVTELKAESLSSSLESTGSEELKSQISHLKKTISQQDETIMELMQQSTRDAQLRDDYEKLCQESEVMNQSIIEFQALMGGQGKESSDLERQVGILTSENDSLRKDLLKERELTTSLREGTDSTVQLSELQRDKRLLEEEKQQLEMQVSQMEIDFLKVRKDAERCLIMQKEKDALEEEKLSLEIQVAQFRSMKSPDDASAQKVLALEKDKERLYEERDQLARDSLQKDDHIEGLMSELKKANSFKADLERVTEDNRILAEKNTALETIVLETQREYNTRSPNYQELRAKVKELEEKLEREQSATVMTILDGCTEQQKSVENNLKEMIYTLTTENESLKKELKELKTVHQNGNDQEVMIGASATLLSAPCDSMPAPTTGNHKLGSSLKKRSEEFRLKEIEEENDRLKSELMKLKDQPYNGTQVAAMVKQMKMLQNKLEDMEKRHRDVVSTYRTHLLSAMQGHMDREVQQALMNIIKIRQAPEIDV